MMNTNAKDTHRTTTTGGTLLLSALFVLLLLLGVAVDNVNCQGMIEWDLSNLPEYNTTPDNPSFPFKWKVQCPANGRCYLRNFRNTVSWGPDPDVNFRSGSWTLASGEDRNGTSERYSWYYFVNGRSESMVSLDDMFLTSNRDPYIEGNYCLNLTNTVMEGDDVGGNDPLSNFGEGVDSVVTEASSTGGGCSMICTDDCLCGLEWFPSEECDVLEEYPDLVLAPPEDRTVIEFLQLPSEDSGAPVTNATERTLQLRCPEFLEGCYLDTTNFESSASSSPSDYDGFYAVDYLQCQGRDRETDTLLPCRFACDPQCECSVFVPSTNTTESCTIAPPTEAPSEVPTTAPSMEVPSSGPSNGGSCMLMLLSTIQLLLLLPVLC